MEKLIEKDLFGVTDSAQAIRFFSTSGTYSGAAAVSDVPGIDVTLHSDVT